MSDQDILSDAEREALSAVMLEPDLPPQRVLIVDDDKDARELLSQILGLDGIRCITAASGETALKLLIAEEEVKKPSIGLVITDLRMGNVDGLVLAGLMVMPLTGVGAGTLSFRYASMPPPGFVPLTSPRRRS